MNRFYGTDWRSHSINYESSLFNTDKNHLHNIYISCVDSSLARIELGNAFTKKLRGHLEPYQDSYYWLDFGNTRQMGQFVLGSFKDNNLPFVTKCFDFKKIKDKDSGPSCSLSAALNRQDLFINSALVQFGMALLWKLFKDARIKYRGAYLSLHTMSVNPIKI